jgi:hypothetical protein
MSEILFSADITVTSIDNLTRSLNDCGAGVSAISLPCIDNLLVNLCASPATGSPLGVTQIARFYKDHYERDLTMIILALNLNEESVYKEFGSVCLSAASPEDIAAGNMELHTQLEEMEPADPGELSPAFIRIFETGEDTCLTAGLAYHVLGCVTAETVREFLNLCRTGREFEVALVDLDPNRVREKTGASLKFETAGENRSLGLYMGQHCFGVLRGTRLEAFLGACQTRAFMGLPECRWAA